MCRRAVEAITTLTGGGGVGGGAGITVAALTQSGTAGAGGTASNGDFNVPGGSGLNAFAISTAQNFSIAGASALAFGPALHVFATAGANSNTAGANATGFGAGGTGGSSHGSGAAAAGGNGSVGCAIFEWYA